MSIPHAASGELIDIQPLAGNLSRTISSTLVRADHLEVFRFVLTEGKSTPDHQAAGAITIQCLEGSVELKAHGKNSDHAGRKYGVSIRRRTSFRQSHREPISTSYNSAKALISVRFIQINSLTKNAISSWF